MIDAIYIHESGGKTLLNYLIETLIDREISFYLLLDERLQSDSIEKLDEKCYRYLAASEKSRKVFYNNLPDFATSIFCFANVPPPVNTRKVPVFILCHNKLLLDNFYDRNGHSVKKRFFFLIKKCYIRFKNKPNYNWIVQTESMKKALASAISVKMNKISIIPFFQTSKTQSQVILGSKTIRSGFIYVADGVEQKNHSVLLDAWDLLFAKYKLLPELHLTIPPGFSRLCKRIEKMAQNNICVINHGVINYEELNTLYQQCQCLVFPSMTESFGLPLIEAANRGCMVIAADLPYVYDVIQPSAVFNEHNAESIAEKVADVLKGKINRSAKTVVTNKLDSLLILISQN